MNWNYEAYVMKEINRAVNDNSITGYDFEVCEEQAFVKKVTLKPTTVYVVIKYLSSTNTLNAVEQPIQLLIFCEDNQINVSQIVFSAFVANNNFRVVTDEDTATYIKQDYREPVVLSNFNQAGPAYKTIMYVSGTLFIMENIIDVSDLTITIGEGSDAVTDEVKPLNFNIAYAMTPNTQQIPPDKLASSVKSLATFSISFSVPLTSGYNFVKVISEVMAGTESGNTDFLVSFSLGDVDYTDVAMKLTSVQITTAIDQIPGLQIGLIK